MTFSTSKDFTSGLCFVVFSMYIYTTYFLRLSFMATLLEWWTSCNLSRVIESKPWSWLHEITSNSRYRHNTKLNKIYIYRLLSSELDSNGDHPSKQQYEGGEWHRVSLNRQCAWDIIILISSLIYESIQCSYSLDLTIIAQTEAVTVTKKVYPRLYARGLIVICFAMVTLSARIWFMSLAFFMVTLLELSRSQDCPAGSEAIMTDTR